jgi:methylthioribose-1-phosphate isomerase
MTTVPEPRVAPLRWAGDALELLDQRRLPHEEAWLRLTGGAEVARAIAEMAVRGAPAIGIAAAYGAALAVREHGADGPALEAALRALGAARPTAVNLGWAIARMRRLLATAPADPAGVALAEAHAIHAEDRAACAAMGTLGAQYLDPGSVVLTHCNTGALATGGIGTALGVLRCAHAAGRLAHVYVDETRPWLQGARLTAWELAQEGIPATLIADAAAPFLMARREVHWLVVGADRIAANGDVANKIGTYAAAVAARAHGVRVMVVAPLSTFDPALPDGDAVPIEERAAAELTALAGTPLAAAGCGAWNPVFDITPGGLVDVIVTERGAIEHPDAAGVAALFPAG